jgi:hypothetical protein
MHTTPADSRFTSTCPLRAQPAPLPRQPRPAARFGAMRLAWAAVAVSGLLSACGGGGGGDDAGGGAGPAAPPPLPPARPAATLTAEEDLAWKSFVLRVVGVYAVTDTDDFILNTTYFNGGRFDFAGLYPAGTGTGPGTSGQSNTPSAATPAGLCKDGGSSSVVRDDKNQNGIYEAGESFLRTAADCKDGNANLNSTLRFDYQATPKFYAKPNDKAIETHKGIATEDRLLTYARTNFILGQSVKGQVDVDISDSARVYRYKNQTRVVDGVTVINNLVLTIARSTQLGPDTDFSLTSMTGSLNIDGITYQVTSSPAIPWKKTSAYLPTAGVFVMTAPNGEQIATSLTPEGAICGTFPAGSTTPTLVVKNCSRF